jgi:2-keto-4-pentenoate hydratase/2-oxohepta-3-ene-1,7-dioic acid hydratase in catechol pathway
MLMRLVSYVGGFGRLESLDGPDPRTVVPMGRDLVAYLAGEPAVEGDPLDVDRLEMLAPVPRPGKIVCVGLNYRDHAAETGKAIPTEPVLFPKWPNSLVPDGAVVSIPPETSEADWEAELGVVIGRRASRVSVDHALEHVAGYTCINDLSARDLQRSGGQWTRGKAIDGFLPMGPWLLTADEVPDPQRLSIQCRLNGQTVQSSSTAQMIFGVAELISVISATMTLEPGDCLVTGTPPGVGMARKPPRFLDSGDRLEVEIDGLGVLRTTMTR